MDLLVQTNIFNRLGIAESSYAHIIRPDLHFRIVNDHSTEFEHSILSKFTDDTVLYEKKLNINTIMYRSFKRWLDEGYDFVYLFDSDIIHDPMWLDSLFKMYYSTKFPVTLYRSRFIESFGAGVSQIIDNTNPLGFIKSGLFGGCSVFLSREHIIKINQNLPINEHIWNDMCKTEAWDSKIQRYIDPQRKYIVPRISLCEHFGNGGTNHKDDISDSAVDMTDYLKAFRKQYEKKYDK